MIESLHQLDRILRGEATRLSALREGIIHISAKGVSQVLIVLGMIYGLCMGTYALVDRGWAGAQQMLATTLKVPLLFFLTLLVTFPSLYVSNALVGSRLSIRSVLRLLVASLGIILTVLASFGTIIAFFSVSTTSYPFMLILNVIVFTVAGVLGLSFLLQTLHRLTLVQEEEPLTPPPLPEGLASTSADPAFSRPDPGALDRTGRNVNHNVRMIFRIWVIVFAVVGAQMAWVLRPFLGNPKLEFTWFRPRESNFFEAVWRALSALLGA